MSNSIRSLSIIAAALASSIATADAAFVPLNLHTAVKDLSEFATQVAEQHEASSAEAVAELSAKLETLTALLIAAGVIPAPAPSEQTSDQPQG